MKMTHFALAAALVLAPAAVLAQSTTPVAPVTSTPTATATKPTIGQRKTDQQDRIAQGVKSGQLTAGETGRLEHQEAGINKEERGMRAQDNGKLSKADKTVINKQQNQESKRIYKDKHNAPKR